MSGAEAMQAAGAFADALRRLHESGATHGALEPCRVILSESGASLTDGVGAHGMTAYSAPEQARGNSADARSDIFAFGAIVYEMLSGQRAFPGEGDELRAAILDREPAPLSVEAGGLERLARRCLAKTPAQRWQRMHNVQMELKLLNVISRRTEQNPAARDERLQAWARQEIARVEEAINARLSAIEAAASDLKAQLAEDREQASALRNDVTALTGRVEEAHEEGRSGVAVSAERIAALSGRMDGIDRALATHGSSIESLGAATAQSDELIERLVDAFDSLERSLAGEARAQAAG